MTTEKTDRPINIIRLYNLYHLMRGSSIRYDTDFCDVIGIKPAQLSQIKDRSKNIGPDIAGKIERAFDKPHGWLDERQAGVGYPDQLIGGFVSGDGEKNKISTIDLVSMIEELPDEISSGIKMIASAVKSITSEKKPTRKTQKPITMTFSDSDDSENNPIKKQA